MSLGLVSVFNNSYTIEDKMLGASAFFTIKHSILELLMRFFVCKLRFLYTKLNFPKNLKNHHLCLISENDLKFDFTVKCPFFDNISCNIGYSIHFHQTI